MSEKVGIRKILRYPKSVVLLSVGTFFPETWRYVIVKVIERKEKAIIIEFTEVDGDLKKILEEDENHA
jgi:hypothetical protein